MPDGSHHPALQRSSGHAFASFAQRRGATRLADLHQMGSAKLMLPRVPGHVPEAVFLNTSGGLTGGDRLAYGLTLGEGCRLVATTQTAERAYACDGGSAGITFRALVGAGSRLDWLPQETLLYQSSNLERLTEIDLAPGAECLLAETVILGRLAMGERPTSARLTDHRRVTRQGRPVWAESQALSPEVLASTSPALLNGAGAVAVVCLVAQGAEDAVGPVRQVLTLGAASGWDGKCVVRLSAAQGWPLKQQLCAVLRVLSGRALPRVWQSGDT